jgi:NADP-dependent 3-hydroxy acid dehydrogenase YdfG
MVGAGSGLSASLARLFAREGLQVVLAARNVDKLSELCRETGARAFACDAAQAGQVKRLFTGLDSEIGAPDVVVYNASGRSRGPFAELAASDVERSPLARSWWHSRPFSACCPGRTAQCSLPARLRA